MNVARYLYDGQDDVSDLQARVRMITALGYNAMVTSHLRFFRLGEYFLRRSQRRLAFSLSVHDLGTIFDERFYDGLEGGILQAIAQLFASDSKLLVYPNLTADGTVRTAENVEVPDEQQYLYRHLLHNRRIIALEPERRNLVPYEPDALRELIAQGDERWRSAVPSLVAERIGELTL
jgi:hypothetical protein